MAGPLPLWFGASEFVLWWVEMSALEGVEAFVPLWFDLFVSDVAGAYWRRLDPRWVAVSAVRCAEPSVWFAFSASASAPRRRQRVGWEGLVVYTDLSAVPNFWV
jgi:hypothetical protein